MRRFLLASCVLALWAAAVPARADDADDAKAVKELIAKAIKAHGGKDVLTKYKASENKMKGTVHVMGMAIDFTGEVAYQAPNRMRIEIDAEVGGMTFKTIQVLAGDKGWISTNGKVSKMTKDMLAEGKEQFHSGAVTRLVVLEQKGYTLSPLGEAKVNGREAVGVRVAHKGYRDVSLYFDKKTHMLVKSETRGKDLMAGGEEYTGETFYSDYKKVDGVQVAHKVVVKRDGKKYVEGEITESKVAEKLDDSVFAKPE